MQKFQVHVIFAVICHSVTINHSYQMYDYNDLEPNFNFYDYPDHSFSPKFLHNENPGLQGHGVHARKFGDQCDSHHQPCDTSRHLECIDGKCVCQNPKNHQFDPSLQQCVSLSRTKCGFSKHSKKVSFGSSQQGLQCTPNAKCLHGICQCAWGFSPTASKTCQLNHGQQCRPHECNADRGLACKNSICQCKDSTSIYKFISARCADPQEEIDRFSRIVLRAVVRNGLINLGGTTGQIARNIGSVALAGLG